MALECYYEKMMRNKNEKMKSITILTHKKQGPSGLETYARLLSIAIDELGYKKTILQPTYLLNYPVIFPKTKDIIHVTSQDLALPLIFRKYNNVIVTVHDIIPLQFPLFEKATQMCLWRFDKWLFKKMIQSLKNATKIICVSDTTKRALLQYITYPEENIYVIHEYSDQKYREKKQKREKYDVLYVGSELPHKNFEVLLKAIAIVKKTINGIRLIKIGKSGWPQMRENHKILAKKLNIEQNIVWKDYVNDLVKEYNKAAILVHPSLHEGFGLPLVEAMACGCPVLSSNKASLPEIGGDAAEYFDATKPEECAKKIIAILQNENKQATMREEGLRWVKRYNKKSFTEQVRNVYEEMR